MSFRYFLILFRRLPVSSKIPIDMKITLSKSQRTLLKGFTTGFLILLMLIPAAFVHELIEERKQRQQEVVTEVTSRWAGNQTITGPYLLLPYRTEVLVDGKPAMVTRPWVLLPDSLQADGQLQPESKRRSIFEVALYRSQLRLRGHFRLDVLTPEQRAAIDWSKVTLCMGVSDLRGIENEVRGQLGSLPVLFEPGLPDNMVTLRGVSAVLDLSGQAADKPLAFDLPLQCRGAQMLQLVPLGKTTRMQLQSTWPSPSFQGHFLPTHQTDASGFKANWQVLHFNRDFPQLWTDKGYSVSEFAFGVSMLQPTDHYTQTLRSVKYAILFIGLSFAFFFLLEQLMLRQVHPVQYVLIGLALIVFYTLLLSIAEVWQFRAAYAVATAATVGLVSVYTRQLFGNWRSALMIGGFLSALYGFIYILINLEDSALLVGSIGLFVLLALAMYASRRIQWYGAPSDQNQRSDLSIEG